MKIDLSPTGWTRVFAATIGGTLFCISIALFVDSFNFSNLSPQALRRAIMIDILVPLFLAGPLLFLLTWKMRQLAIAHRELSHIASTDSLTAVLNRGAFSMLVKAYLEQTKQQAPSKSGALLVIDADHFKSINDQLGHDRGDQALKMIAEAIKGVLRSPDIVGRIGGEEFGVFLPGANPQQASTVAERICQTIRESEFRPNGATWQLSVSIGGVTFDQETSYDELFIAADERLYRAKSSGRNRVDMVPLAQLARPSGASMALH